MSITVVRSPWIIAVSVVLLSIFSGVTGAEEVPRTVFVHLFEWKWTDVARECEQWLGPKGYAAVQISPPQEHLVLSEGSRKYPWWQRYQPVSYQLESRSGTRDQLKDMISRCNRVGVKVYADAIINHMVGIDQSEGVGSGGCSFKPGTREYPCVPYGPNDFHEPPCNVNYQDANSVRNCWIEGTLSDLNTNQENVRQKIADYVNDLISIGVAGFRIDGGKHMMPADIAAVLAKVNDLGSAIDPATGRPFHQRGRPYIFLEVIGADGQPVRPAEYVSLGNVSEFAYGRKLAAKFRDPNQKLADLKTFPGHPGSTDWGLLPSSQAVAFTDNHDNQRGHGSGAWQADGRIANILTFHYDGNLYNLANVFMLAWPYGYPDVMSSYDWERKVQQTGNNKYEDLNDWVGPPADSQGRTNDVGCDRPEWICEHRWGNIANMVAFRNYTGQQQEDWTVTHWWDNGNNAIAFGRNGKGFVIINKESTPLTQKLPTGMPPGRYCDVLSGDFDQTTKTCTGPTVLVDASGSAIFNVSPGRATAIHVGAGGPDGYRRTVVFMFGTTIAGQDMFLRGGIDHTYGKRVLGRTCETAVGPTYQCAMPIRHNNLRNDTTKPWKEGELYLDWYGREPGQDGVSHGIQAAGSALDWTTHNPSHGKTVERDGYGFEMLNQIHSLGDHYWMFDVMMNCSQGVQAGGDSWFEVKSYISNIGNGWEGNINQVDTPYRSQNHFAKCGKINVFRRNENTAAYYDFLGQ